jgi:hypothetical protein
MPAMPHEKSNRKEYMPHFEKDTHMGFMLSVGNQSVLCFADLLLFTKAPCIYEP